MKLSASLILVAALSGSVLVIHPAFAQFPSSSSSSSSSLGGGASVGLGAGTVKSLPESDKHFIREAGDGMLALQRLAEITGSGSAATPAIDALSTKLNDEAVSQWGELSSIAEAHNIEMPKVEPSSADKREMEKLKKVDPKKFGKEYMKVLNKELKKLDLAYDSAAKSAQDPELKAFITKWASAVKADVAEAKIVETDTAKAK